MCSSSIYTETWDLQVLCLAGTDCPPSLSRETAEECDLDPHPPLQREKDEHIGAVMMFMCNCSIENGLTIHKQELG